MIAKQVYAEDLNYWKTSHSSVDSWLDKCEKEIEVAGGFINSRAVATQNGKTAILLEFALGGDNYMDDISRLLKSGKIVIYIQTMHVHLNGEVKTESQPETCESTCDDIWCGLLGKCRKIPHEDSELRNGKPE